MAFQSNQARRAGDGEVHCVEAGLDDAQPDLGFAGAAAVVQGAHGGRFRGVAETLGQDNYQVALAGGEGVQFGGFRAGGDAEGG